ncbi:17450_t:CDS:2, partial [Entrophospora sp. SA101]
IPNRPAVLQKDFIIDTYQIMKARIYGTDTVLLIAAILDDEKLAKLYNFAKSLGMEPLVEVNSKEEMTRAIKLGAKVDLSTTSQLAKMVHEGKAMMKAQDKKAFIDEILGIKKVETKPTITKSPIKPLVKICSINTIDAAITVTELGADLIGGCGKFFEGTAEQMYNSLIKTLGVLPSDTKVYCGHEYTTSNLRFAKSIDPNNKTLLEKYEWAAQNKITVPSTIGDEFKFNPFMRVEHEDMKKVAGGQDPIEIMKKLREMKNEFK